jgi:formiminoglutamase
LTYANYLAYEKSEQIINLVCIDNQLNLGEADEKLNSRSFLSKIILHQPNFLFNYSNIGLQRYFVKTEELDLMYKLFFDTYRLGEVIKNIEVTEPVIRNADIVSIDFSAIRSSDSAGNKNATPNGFYSEQVCQMARFAGLSDKLTSFGVYEVNPAVDINEQTTLLAAEAIWYFTDGFYNRKKESPLTHKKDFLKYRVELDKHELIFYKSRKTDRWWMNVPYPPTKGMKYERHHIVPCSYTDYQMACNNEMPDRWWKAYQKLL